MNDPSSLEAQEKIILGRVVSIGTGNLPDYLLRIVEHSPGTNESPGSIFTLRYRYIAEEIYAAIKRKQSYDAISIIDYFKAPRRGRSRLPEGFDAGTVCGEFEGPTDGMAVAAARVVWDEFQLRRRLEAMEDAAEQCKIQPHRNQEISKHLIEALASIDQADSSEATAGEQDPIVRCLGDLTLPPEDNDLELIHKRFFCRGSICMLFGMTGIGKSSFVMQLAIHLSIGRTFLGIEPGKHYRDKGMRILLIQAENDDHDLAEMREGVYAGCSNLSAEEIQQANQKVCFVTINDRTSDHWKDTIERKINNTGPYDLIITDPALSYIGGQSNAQVDVGHFMRELIMPMITRHKVGMLLCHHTNKPPQGKERDSWSAGDFAYLGAGSAEWINPARAALAIRSIGSETVYELRAVKRGRRLLWHDANNESTTIRHIAYHKQRDIICWREADENEIPRKEGANQKYVLNDILKYLNSKALKTGEWKTLVMEEIGMSKNTFLNLKKVAEEKGYIKKDRLAKGWIRTLKE